MTSAIYETRTKLVKSEHDEIIRLIDNMHYYCSENKVRCVLFIVGGGALATGWLFGRPGASSWLLEARIPYGKNSLKELFAPKVIDQVRFRKYTMHYSIC